MRDPDPAVRVAVAEPSLLGESPMWHPREQVLYWCDIAGRRLNRHDPRSQAFVHWPCDTEPASIAPHLAGGLVVAMRDGLWRFDTRHGTRSLLASPPYDPGKERFNDGKCDPRGRFWVGTIYEPRDPRSRRCTAGTGTSCSARPKAPRRRTDLPGVPTAAPCTGATRRPTRSMRSTSTSRPAPCRAGASLRHSR
jgi:sugar lactone lactonase YvrE